MDNEQIDVIIYWMEIGAGFLIIMLIIALVLTAGRERGHDGREGWD